MIYSKTAISDLLYNTSRMFDIAIDDTEIHDALLAINFTDQKVAALKATWTTANTATEGHKKAIEDQRKEKVKFQKALWDSNAIYMTHMKYAKSICYGDPERWAKLGLSLRRKRKFNDMLLQSSVFYSNILEDPDLLLAFDEKFGETQADIEAGQQSMAGVNKSREDYMTAIGNSQSKKADRDVALKQLDNEATGFHAVLRKALKDNLQHLEKVNIKVYSPGYKKKKPEAPPPEEPAATDPPATDPNAQTTDPPTTDPNPSQ